MEKGTKVETLKVPESGGGVRESVMKKETPNIRGDQKSKGNCPVRPKGAVNPLQKSQGQEGSRGTA